MNKSVPPPLVLIAGPTASGKSALAMALADLTPSVVINADSMQVYRDLRVLTARPSEADEARHPHRLFGYIDGAEACSAARWASDAKSAIADAHAERRLPILVGGTGLYIRTLLDGIAPVPEIDPNVRKAIRAMPVADAYAALTREDADAAARLGPKDASRVMRALEVIRSTGRPLAAWQIEREGGIGKAMTLSAVVLDPPRDWLDAQIDRRFDAMIDQGCAEATRLRERSLFAVPVLGAIGAMELDPVNLRDEGLEAAVAAAKLRTRQYAKRQRTWFARQAPQSWPRIVEQLNNDSIYDLAIILRDGALTA